MKPVYLDLYYICIMPRIRQKKTEMAQKIAEFKKQDMNPAVPTVSNTPGLVFKSKLFEL